MASTQPSIIEITGIYLRDKWRADDSDFVIGQIRLIGPDGKPVRGPDLAVKGEADRELLAAHRELRFYGSYKEDDRFGRQFEFKSVIRAQPHSEAGIVRYLQECDGVGPVTAQTLWAKFGSDAVRILRETPEVAMAAVPKLTAETASKASDRLKSLAAIEGCTIDLMGLLDGYGIRKSVSTELIKKYGVRAAEVIRRNPYKLLKHKGVGIPTANAVYESLGLPLDRLRRQAYGVYHDIKSDREGHTWVPVSVAEDAIRKYVGAQGGNAVRAVEFCMRTKPPSLETYWDSRGKLWLADGRKARAEEVIAEEIARALDEPHDWPDVSDLDVSDHQREHLANALQATVCNFTGGAGCGKTYTIARLARRLIQIHGEGCVVFSAPTNLAAVRITQAMEKYGLSLRGVTHHSMLRVDSVEDGEWSFKHGKENPLPYKFIIADESSMNDCEIKAALLLARGRGTHICFVGDKEQLMPVGYGAPFRDLYEVLPTGRLTEIQRNAGSIVRACKAISEQQRIEIDDELDPENGRNLMLLPSTGGRALDAIVQTIKQLADLGLADPIWDCQVVCAVHERSPVSRKAINERLQAELNPHGKSVERCPFRVGDKIMCMEKGTFPVAEAAPRSANREEIDGKVLIVKGEFGRVLAVSQKSIVASFDYPERVVNISFNKREEGDGAGGSFSLAYGATCHRVQGSEFRFVFVVLDDYYGAQRVCSRQWALTGISRAREACFLVGKRSTLDAMCKRDSLNIRKTFLVEKIREKVAARSSTMACAGAA